MERGVVIGGLMICGSFLLAAMLNRSAMKELPPTPAPIQSVMPATAPTVQPVVAPSVTDCAQANTRGDANHPAVGAESRPADLRVNGPDACRR